MNYSGVLLLADAIERAASRGPRKVIVALDELDLRRSHHALWADQFVNGQNQGAAPVNTQVSGNDIKVIFPADLRRRQAGVPGARPEQRTSARRPSQRRPP